MTKFSLVLIDFCAGYCLWLSLLVHIMTFISKYIELDYTKVFR